MVLVTIGDGLSGPPLPEFVQWGAAGSAWLAASLLIRNTSLALRLQVGVLLAAGVGILWYAGNRGAHIDFLRAANTNHGLLSMIAAVGFLRLVTLPATGMVRRLPVGRRAYLQTLLGVGIFASVINISAPILIADRIHRERPLARFTTQSIIRVFCAMSNWSPFFGAMAAVLTTVGGASLKWIVITSLPFSILCAFVVFLEANWRYRDQMTEFVGYPLERESLLVPVVLLFSVGILAQLLPDISILVIIAVCALLVTTLLLYLRQGASKMNQEICAHVINALPGMVGELSLFLAAGVLATAMSAMIDVGIITSPFDRFDAVTAIELLGLMILLAIAGIHPIIPVSSLTPLLMPLQPNLTLLAIVYLTAWNLGTGSSYLSGTQLVFQGRYGIPSWKSASWNWPYSLLMYCLAAGWIWIIAPLLPGP